MLKNIKMISKGLLVFFVFFFLCADAKGRGVRVRTRIGMKIFYEYKMNVLSISNIGSSNGSSSESSLNPLAIIGIIFFLFPCVCRILWKYYECFRKEQHRQQQMYYYSPANSEQICTIDQLNQTNLSPNQTDVSETYVPFIILVKISHII